jgi:hypothetical protein
MNEQFPTFILKSRHEGKNEDRKEQQDEERDYAVIGD